VTAMVQSIKSKFLTSRVSNIYDLNPKTFLFKFMRPESKQFMLIESGVRIHSTDFAREKSKIPSGFSLKVWL